ncbi:VPA1262 family N-terminal domain-containing protein [Tardiphaga sp. P9-11]|uniref:VPA1262 family N-terminal domain-containing protein n=1 Tax=Tardiphaga sp. P9-11 TaxID=2024614 RepID=UPI0011F2BB68|nr:VPA1262 family N-terminal domain-containing protein [Tardiphaga sp. P9-11]
MAKERELSFARAIARITKIAVPGVVGFHTHFEITEIFEFSNTTRKTTNVFTLLVAEEHSAGVSEKPVWLGERIRLPHFRDSFFGIRRTVRPIAAILPCLNDILDGIWRSSSGTFDLGEMASGTPVFVAPDSSFEVPWNRLLKNNFDNGAHVFELIDQTKHSFRPFFDTPRLLLDLSAKVMERVPIRIGSMSDKLGNIVVQIPVTVVLARFSQLRASGDTHITLAWHPSATPRPLRAVSATEFDNAIDGYASQAIAAPQATLPTAAGDGQMENYLWDDQEGVLLAAQGRTGFIRQINFGIHALGGNAEPRAFKVRDGKGKYQSVQIGVSSAMNSTVGPLTDQRAFDWARARIYREENDRLVEQSLFKQYTPGDAPSSQMHESALDDIRRLINRHGRYGAWLWDPYLSAHDVLKTLFYCIHSGADLRALTAANEPPHQSVRTKPTFTSLLVHALAVLRATIPYLRPPTPPSFAELQQQELTAAESNNIGLRFEYRMKAGQDGWPFHDRFLIFPQEDGSALAWSLGISVNQIGRSHHILQRVDDGRRIMDAFLDLWDELAKPEHLIWKTP